MSFWNDRYVEETIQRTGVAIETQGFTLVTSGKKRESLLGNATLHLYPQMKGLIDIQNSLEYVSTEVTTSKQKQFSLVTFIDTPGLLTLNFYSWYFRLKKLFII